MTNKSKDTFIIGFAIFATFFGAGNLIFPPYLGVMTGQSWPVAFAGFMFSDVLLSVAAVVVTGKYLSGNFTSKAIPVLSRSGHKLSLAISYFMIASVPVLVIPRTAATAFEIAVQPHTTSFPPIVFSALFFGVTLLLSIRPTKAVDNIGKILTPIMLLALAVLIIKGFVTPLGVVREEAFVKNLFSEGLMQGYLTQDALGGVVLPITIMATIVPKGYTDQKEKNSVLVRASIVTAVCLFLVYGGLCYIGTTVSTEFGADVNHTQLVVHIVNSLLGGGGAALLSIIILLACLTTAIGVTASSAQYFTTVFNNKIKYEYWIIGLCIFCTAVSCLSVAAILKFSGPILQIIYPVVIAMILLSIFGDRIKNDTAFHFATYMTILVGILNGIGVPFMSKLPFTNLGFNWAIPTAIAAIIGIFVPSGRKAK